jgi:tRNA-splicing ligase RtcB
MNYTEFTAEGMKVPLKIWNNKGIIPIEGGAIAQMAFVSQLPFVHHHAALMSDAHAGIGCCVGSVVPTDKAIIPSVVGVDIGCGMVAVRTTLTSNDVAGSGQNIFEALVRAIPAGFSKKGGLGNWSDIPENVANAWESLKTGYKEIVGKNSRVSSNNAIVQLGTLGSGNHFCELCIDEKDNIWLMLHSGSRGAGNCIGTYFIEKARKEMESRDIRLPNKDLAYLEEGSEYFADYVQAVSWAQEYAFVNRQIMMDNAIAALKKTVKKSFKITEEAINCHHNYISKETHFDKEVYVSRKGAIRVRKDELGIIPGSMGTKSYIVRGKGNADSFNSCSHGAGRVMSRTAAKQNISLEDHRKATDGVFCRKDKSVIDESPAAYKDIDQVIEAQKDIIDIVHTLKQVVCIKG